MENRVKILAFAGSTRKDSYNKKLVKIACKGAEELGAHVTYIDLHDYPLPLYDGDLEAEYGLPKNAIRLKALMREHDGFLISSPEYNSSISGVLKNVIDWTTRKELPEERDLVCYKNKVAMIMSASPSYLGGLRGLVTLRSILGNIGVLVLPEQHSIAIAHEAFDENGNLLDEKKEQNTVGLGRNLVGWIQNLKGK